MSSLFSFQNSQRLPDRFRTCALFGSGKDWPENSWKALGRQLIVDGFLRESCGQSKFSTTCRLTKKVMLQLKELSHGDFSPARYSVIYSVSLREMTGFTKLQRIRNESFFCSLMTNWMSENQLEGNSILPYPVASTLMRIPDVMLGGWMSCPWSASPCDCQWGRCPWGGMPAGVVPRNVGAWYRKSKGHPFSFRPLEQTTPFLRECFCCSLVETNGSWAPAFPWGCAGESVFSRV